MKIQKKSLVFWGGRGGVCVWGGGGRRVGVDVNREVNFLSKLKKKFEGGGQGRVGGGGSKVSGRWGMWGMGDINQE